jgi:RNA recognition motif-containing protein
MNKKSEVNSLINAIKSAQQDCASKIAERLKLLLKIEEELEKGRKLDSKLAKEKKAGITEREEASKTFFVGRLTTDTVQDDITNYFMQLGIVTDVKLAKNEKTGKSLCYALVTFTKIYDDETFLEKPHKINGRRINLEDNSSTGSKSILVKGHMVKYLTNANVVEFFSSFGEVKNVTIDAANNNRLVEFESSDAVNKALGESQLKNMKIEKLKYSFNSSAILQSLQQLRNRLEDSLAAQKIIERKK